MGQCTRTHDIDGDLIADDMSGDGVVFLGDEAALTPKRPRLGMALSDLAWVLRLQPRERWRLPQADDRTGGSTGDAKGVAQPASFAGISAQIQSDGNPASTESVFHLPGVDLDAGVGRADSKALPNGGSLGDDLFVAIRTSSTIGAHEKFRALVPSRLPSRNPQSEQIGGIEMTPRAYSVAQSFLKLNPDEGAVQDFYGHDMLESNVGARVIPLEELLAVGGVPTIEPGSPAQAILGLDLSVNRPEYIAAQGTSGTLQAANVFTTGGTISSRIVHISITTPGPTKPSVSTSWH